jgi:hypothetical protein
VFIKNDESTLKMTYVFGMIGFFNMFIARLFIAHAVEYHHIEIAHTHLHSRTGIRVLYK